MELSNNEKALLVRKIETNAEFIVDARDLTFSGRWNLCEEFLDKEFDMLVEQRQDSLRLSRLPLIEKSLQDYLKSAYGNIPCRLIEKQGRNLNFVIEDLAEKGVIEGAYMGKYSGDKTEYEIGKTYSLFLDGNYGIKHETIAPPPEGLEKLIEEEKLRHKLFWNNWQGRLHVKKPMDSDIKAKLFHLTDNSEFHNSIVRLYQHSNSIRVKTKKSKPPLETGEQARRQEYLNDDIPEYRRGEKVTGRISAIYDNNVKVVLDRGGSGNVFLGYLSWKKIIDPREVVYADQKVEAMVIEQRFDKKKGKILIDLSLLDKQDFPIDKYYQGSVHEAKIVILGDYYALAELEAGLTGVIDKSEIQHELVENIRDHLKLNQKVNVRIISLKISPIDPKRPLSIKLSIKEAFSRDLPIPKEKIGLLLGKNGSTIQELKRKSRCGIWCNTEKRIVEIKSCSDDKIENAVSLINELLNRDQGKFPPDREGKRRQYAGQKKDYVSELKIPVGKIGLLVGKGGSMVSQITEKSESLIQIENNGTVHIMSRNEKNINRAIELISNLIP